MIDQPCRLWHIDDVRQMILCAIVLHNMIVEERSEFDPYLNTSETVNTPHIQANHRDPSLHYTLASTHQNHILLRQETVHHRITHDLKTHIWMAQGGL